jgi:hypothetical protein
VVDLPENAGGLESMEFSSREYQTQLIQLAPGGGSQPTTLSTPTRVQTPQRREMNRPHFMSHMGHEMGTWDAGGGVGGAGRDLPAQLGIAKGRLAA